MVRALICFLLLAVPALAQPSPRGGPCDVRGCTMTGALTVTSGGALSASFTNFGRAATYTLSGSTIDTTKMGLFVNNNINGTSTATEVPALGYFTAASMNVNAPTTLIDGVNMVVVTGGAAAASAGWQTLSLSMNDGSAATNDLSGGGAGAFVPLQIARRASKNQGGSGLTPATSFGQNWGIDVVSTIQNGATDLALNNGVEVDLATQAGGSVMRSAGFQVGHATNHAVQSAMWDYGYLALQAPSSAPFKEIYAAGGGLSTHAPLDSTGTFIGYHLAQDVTAPANKGVDLNDGTFTTCSLCAPGFTVSGSGTGLGTTRMGSVYVTPVSNGVQIDAIGAIGSTAATVSSGGSGFTDGASTIVDDQYGGIEQVNSTSGVVTSVTAVKRQPVFQGLTGTPSTMTTTARPGSSGTGLVLSQTWDVTRKHLFFNPSALGEVVIGSGSQAGALNGTTGFFHFPFTNATSGSGGIPTGTPSSIFGDACQWNDVTFTLNCYSASAGAWKHVTFSASAG